MGATTGNLRYNTGETPFKVCGSSRKGLLSLVDPNSQVFEQTRPAPIYVVSGNLGTLGEQLTRTILAQFTDVDVPVRIVPRVIFAEKIEQVVAEVKQAGGTIVHTLVDSKVREVMIEVARRNGVVAIDAISPLLTHLTEKLGQEPIGKPGMYRLLHQSYFKRIDAIDFTMEHDDGKNYQNWKDAEIVLVGVSRVGKTPISLYLSMLGWRVANVPLVYGITPRPELFALDRRKVVGITLEPGQLVQHRRFRQQRLGTGGLSVYDDPEKVFEETIAAKKIFQQGGFRVVDATDKPIETSAEEVIALTQR